MRVVPVTGGPIRVASGYYTKQGDVAAGAGMVGPVADRIDRKWDRVHEQVSLPSTHEVLHVHGYRATVAGWADETVTPRLSVEGLGAFTNTW